MTEVPFPKLKDDDDLSGWLDLYMPNPPSTEVQRWQVLLNTEWNNWTTTIQFADEEDAIMFSLRWL